MDDAMKPTQYRVLAEHRLHFSRLFYQVVAFILFVTLAGSPVLASQGVPDRVICVIMGGVLALTAFITHRLRQQEDTYARLLRELEQPPLLQPPYSARWGARALVVACLLCAGLALIVMGLSGGL